MTKREMLSLLIKLMGLYAIVQLVPGLLQGMFLFAQGVLTQIKEQPAIAVLATLVSMFIAPLLWIGLCVWVIRKSDAFAARLYPTDAPAGQLTTLGTAQVQRLGYHFIGLMLIIKSLPTILNAIYRWMVVYRLYAEEGYPSPGHDQTYWISISVQLAIGLYLFLYPRGLANVWARIQGKSWSKDDDYDI